MEVIMQYYFRAEKLSVGYHGHPLIENMEIALEKGEILTLIGPNGAGKSTVLKSIARQLALVGGTLWLDKKNMGEMSRVELSQNMAVMLTRQPRTELMTCEDVVESGRYPYTGRFGILSETDRRRVGEAMELVRVADIKDKDFTQISDGQKQRVTLAGCLCQEPEILILDEPTSYLDVKHKLEFLSVLQEMKRKKKLTVIMSLHELELAKRISDKILCINGRYIERFGTPEEVFSQGALSKMFDISSGSMDEENGNLELPAPKGEAGIFVIAGGGTGRSVYHRLQRQGIPFATGILFGNDLDYPVAKALAADVIEAESFEPITEAQVNMARKKLEACEKVICCKESFGTYERANRELAEYARKCGKPIEIVKHRDNG
ncbi:MAG: ABC transporter ATP-binding protein [Lachnoclostridium sp.]|nr:ABC transporter ATP-binding protein [Lachnospira sp.]MCM1247176.1 ABC transporter ATP-binding protein [Lachnoclostridium sp.]